MDEYPRPRYNVHDWAGSVHGKKRLLSCSLVSAHAKEEQETCESESDQRVSDVLIVLGGGVSLVIIPYLLVESIFFLVNSVGESLKRARFVKTDKVPTAKVVKE